MTHDEATNILLVTKDTRKCYWDAGRWTHLMTPERYCQICRRTEDEIDRYNKLYTAAEERLFSVNA